MGRGSGFMGMQCSYYESYKAVHAGAQASTWPWKPCEAAGPHGPRTPNPTHHGMQQHVHTWARAPNLLLGQARAALDGVGWPAAADEVLCLHSGVVQWGASGPLCPASMARHEARHDRLDRLAAKQAPHAMLGCSDLALEVQCAILHTLKGPVTMSPSSSSNPSPSLP